LKALKKLAGQTAIYGLPSIVGRLFNYVLVPLHTSTFLPERFGVITEMYSYVAFLVVMLTYGMETAYFRFQTKTDNLEKSDLVYSTVIISLITTTGIFIGLNSFFSQEVANYINYPDNSEFVLWFSFIVGFDAISSIALAKLRIENRPLKFAVINIATIAIFVGLNFFWLYYCLPQYESGNRNFLITTFYSPSMGIGYVFLANLIASAFKLAMLSPSFFKMKFKLNIALLKEMFKYSAPVLIASLAIIINENLDKIMLKWMLLDELGNDGATEQVGIYGACYKLSIIISLFIQAFRYAAEPFFFSQEKEKDSKEVYALILKYFVIVLSVIFLGVTLFIDIFKYFIPREEYWVGLKVVPILLMANIFLGIFYNLSVWYKLNGKTKYGAFIASIGAMITVVLNLILIPKIGYLGSAWATLVCYFSMAVISYLYGQKHFKVNYSIKSIFLYLGLAVGFFYLSTLFNLESESILKMGVNGLIMIGFLLFIFVLEKPKKAIIS
jgi:O-antigen/teichoic acid export membrane protein